MTTSVSAVAALENLVESGAFASQAAADIDRMFRHGDRGTFYSKTLATEGRAAAERQLTEWDKRQHRTLYASCVEPVARGIVALAKAKDDSLVDITACTTHVDTRINGENGPRSKFIVFNTQAPGYGSMQPTGSYTFGPSGELGLRAVILETGYGYDGWPKAELGLVLPAWGTGQRAPKPGDLVIAKLDTIGYSRGAHYNAYVYTDQGTAEDFTDADAFLRHLLGMKSIEGKVGVMQAGISIGQAMGFPGAEDYLAAKLPELGNYFTALAEKLSTPHTH
ncbi:MAG TPA: hypothetical protein VD907_06135 [Verrucomicrobiae bacterium]|nr:hypothetical protein [Verrucomicrobiae bacterium]